MRINEFCQATLGKSLETYLGESVGSPNCAQEVVDKAVNLLKEYTNYIIKLKGKENVHNS